MTCMSKDFTEERYGELLNMASSRFGFCRLATAKDSDMVAIWRHDVDFSPNRALRLAAIEAERGLTATYYIQLTSLFYNVFEKSVAKIVREISSFGHEVGLHFDPTVDDGNDKIKRLIFEASCLEQIIEEKIVSFSLHNPDTFDNSLFDGKNVGGLLNASSSKWREEYTYCSDSNGIWRYRPLKDVLIDETITRVYVLTHPEWWQQDYMLARDRVIRCVDGRASAVMKYYDDLCSTLGRVNEGK